jgi:mono/diheme cytochrome c family protein
MKLPNHKAVVILTVTLLTICSFSSCHRSDDRESVGSQDWLTGDTRQKLETIANHLRGFDMAMVETGYRYTELYWAGYDENWDYARYQIEKIAVALDRGLERRPARAASAQAFMKQSVPVMEEAIETEERDIFLRRFDDFTRSCNACHAAESVPHFNVVIPDVRQSPIQLD